MAMKVALVQDWLTGMRGGEKVLEVFCELFPDADLYTLLYFPQSVSPLIRSMNVRASWMNRLPGIMRYYLYGLPLFPSVIERFVLKDYDLVLSSSHCVAKGVIPGDAVHISYVHAPMRYVWDLHDAYFGHDAPLLARAGMGVFRKYLQAWDLRSAGRVDHFVANSEHVAAKIDKIYRRQAEVVYPPVDLDKFAIGQSGEGFYLIVSALVPYKNIALAIAAFNRLRLPLKIVGEGPLKQQLERQAGRNVDFLGWVDEPRLADLYASCEAVIFPGEEDFGIVAVEAQASGRPVIAYDKGGVRETVLGLGEVRGDGSGPTGIFFSESTPASLIQAVGRYQQNRSMFDPAALRRHAAQFSRAVFKDRMRGFIANRRRYRRNSTAHAC